MLDEDARPVRQPMIGLQGPAGDAASSEAIRKLSKHIATSRSQRKAMDHVRAAVAALRVMDYQTADRRALKALELDERLGVAWHALAISREKLGHFIQAIHAYEAALALIDEETDVAHDLARLAQRLGQNDIAEKLQRRYLGKNPGHLEATNNLASLLREEKRYDEAIETIRPLIEMEPHHPLLWNTLGSILNDQGRVAEAITFFDEALRLNPTFSKARFNRGGAYQGMGLHEKALEDIEAALRHAEPGYDEAMMKMARGIVLLSMGRIREGMMGYEERFSPELPEAPHYLFDIPRWKDEDLDLRGKHILIAGEQGLADEVLFANALQDAIDAVGPEGRIYVSVEKRLVSLFQRSFPQAVVGDHRTTLIEGRIRRAVPLLESEAVRERPLDLWAPLGELTSMFRPTVSDFPERKGHLVADPERVERWKAELEKLGPGLKIGLHWKSLVLTGSRARYFSHFDRWKPVLTTPGCHMVNLQCGDVSEELKIAENAGVKLWTPPFDLKDDIEDLAAMSKALDLVIGPGIAGVNIAAAVGGRTWMATLPDDWHLLGTDRYPFYPAMKCFKLDGFDGWPRVIAQFRQALERAVEGEWPSE